MKSRSIFAILLIALSNCTNSSQHAVAVTPDTLKTTEATTLSTEKEAVRRNEVLCDTVYSNKGYKLTLSLFDSSISDYVTSNTLFTLSKLINGKYIPLYTDSILCQIQAIKFADYNNDHVKDILVQNTSDVRSNLTYNLYLVDTVHDKLRKIKGFQEIKNPNYLPEYDLIDNYVMSGEIWTSFYKIQNGSIKDFGITIHDNQKDDSYERDYKKAIRSILAKEKKKHR
jgi:hypothetical protein